jgi:hypothetical protein
MPSECKIRFDKPAYDAYVMENAAKNLPVLEALLIGCPQAMAEVSVRTSPVEGSQPIQCHVSQSILFIGLVLVD